MYYETHNCHALNSFDNSLIIKDRQDGNQSHNDWRGLASCIQKMLLERNSNYFNRHSLSKEQSGGIMGFGQTTTCWLEQDDGSFTQIPERKHDAMVSDYRQMMNKAQQISFNAINIHWKKIKEATKGVPHTFANSNKSSHTVRNIQRLERNIIALGVMEGYKKLKFQSIIERLEADIKEEKIKLADQLNTEKQKARKQRS